MGRLSIPLLLLCLPQSSGEPPEQDVPSLIDALVNVSDADAREIYGVPFLPFADLRYWYRVPLDAPRSPLSAIMLKIVRRGAAALPHLVDHLSDRRRARIRQGIYGARSLCTEYDFNPRTLPQDSPVWPLLRDRWRGWRDPVGRTADHRTITVGDLCFVAIGQIVNRSFRLTHAQPTNYFVINSPTLSPKLGQRVAAEWGGMDARRHRASLIADFRYPDRFARRIGAYERLAYYYPQSVEDLVLEQLDVPACSGRAVWEFQRDVLYKISDPERWQALFEQFVAKEGGPAKEGLLEALLEDYDTWQANEQGNLHPPRNDPKRRPDRALRHLYPEIRTTEPPYPKYWSDYDQKYFLEALVRDASPIIDRAVFQLCMRSLKERPQVSAACLPRLLLRGYRSRIERELPKHGKLNEKHKPFLEALKTSLHAAAKESDDKRAALLLAEGEDVNAKDRDGCTPLHIAAQVGAKRVVELLLRGASIEAKDDQGHTPVQLAAAEGRDEVVSLLLSKGAEIRDLLTAVYSGRKEQVAAFLKAGPPQGGGPRPLR